MQTHRISHLILVFAATLLASSLPAIAGAGSGSDSLDLGARIQPAPTSARFELPGYYVWCGAPLEGGDGKYHLFYARWPADTELPPGRAWALHSEIAYAVGDGPFGPFHHVSVILPARGINPATGKKFWDGDCTLNPNILRHPDGKLYLFYMGNHGDLKDYATHRNHQRIGVAVADRPEGPWTRFDKPVIDVSDDPAAFDSLVATNPAATLRPDGQVLLIYKAVAQLPGKVMGGRVRYGAALATHPTGPFVKTPGRIFLPTDGDDGKTWMFAEDPFIWFDKKHGDRFYAVTRDVAGKFTGDLGAITLFESADGLDWRPAPHPLVLPSSYAIADGTRSDIKLERPVVLLDHDEPVALYGGAGGYHKRGRLSANIQIPFGPATSR